MMNLNEQPKSWFGPKSIVAGILAIVVLITFLTLKQNLLGWCDGHEFVVKQSVSGELSVVNHNGFFWLGFGKQWHWPITMEAEYSEEITRLSPQDDSIEATFNDGGTAKISSYVKVGLPTSDEQRLRLHKEFGGDPLSLRTSIKAHETNCIKAAGPVMSASENQAARKAEFNQIVEEQLSRGLFKMNRTQIELDQDVVEQTADGKTVQKKAKVYATEIVNDKEGHPIVIQESPLANYGISIRQFSITETHYDPKTKEQFGAKKESYLAAERAKAERQMEVQQRLMVEEKGRRQVADVQADENQKKERATIQATQAAEVAMIAKTQAVTAAAQKTEVAEQERQEALKRKEIAQIASETAELQKKSTISQAEGQRKVLELAGGMSDKDRVTLEIQRDRDIGVAKALSQMNVPGTVLIGGGDGKGADMNSTLMSVMMLRETGIIGGNKSFKPVSSANPATN